MCYSYWRLGVALVILGVLVILGSIDQLDTIQNSTMTSEVNKRMLALAFGMVCSGLAILLLPYCLEKIRRRGSTTSLQGPPCNYNVSSYEEAVTSGQYPVHQSNLPQSTSQLPSYEELFAAVENEGEQRGEGGVQNARNPVSTPAPNSGPDPTPSPAPAAANSQLTHSGSRLRALRVRRIKSETLHAKNIRLMIENPPQGERVTIEPLTPPPQYKDKVSKLAPEGV